MTSSQRNGLIVIVLAAAAGFAFYQAESFWGVFAMGFVLVWALFSLLPVMDSAWRMKVGFVVATFVAAVIALWPTANAFTRVDPNDEKSAALVPIPEYIRKGIGFTIVKGLDLQGGLRLVYTVEVEEAIRDKRDKFADEMRQELATSYKFHTGEGLMKREELAKLDEKIRICKKATDCEKPGGEESAVLRLEFKTPDDTKMIDERFLKKFGQELAQVRLSKDEKPGTIVFKIRSEVETATRDRAVAQAKETVNRRVDELGLREPSVTTRDEDIILEVPGSDRAHFDDIKEIIRKTARLEFKMCDDQEDFFQKHVRDTDIPAGENISMWQEQVPIGLDEKGGKKYKTNGYPRIKLKEKEPGVKESMNDALARFKAWAKTLPVPDNRTIGFEKIEDYDPDTGKTTEDGWRAFYLESRAEVTGDYITDAQRALNQQQGIPEVYVAITFSPAGADRFEEVTGAHVNERFAIILDDTINSAPVIKSKIAGGHASITMGQGDPDQQLKNAEKLEMVLRSGALPAPISLSNESVIGPTLGKDAIKNGAIGAIVGASAVILFMLLYYRKSGFVADAAVIFNLLIQLAILASFSGTLTLPGIAGLALTIGIGVDANVLINERIREELRAGRSIRAAVEAGYDKAFTAIIDGHATLFISGLILAQYGTGPVKGFAVTMIIGVIASLFTGVFCTRLVFDWWVRGAKVKRLSVGAEF